MSHLSSERRPRVALFSAAKCRELMDDWSKRRSIARRWASLQSHSQSEPAPLRSNCDIGDLLEPRPCAQNVRMWLPSRLVHMATWSPALPASSFHASYVRRCPARDPTDLRPQADVIESPPANLLEQEGGVGVTVPERCRRQAAGTIDVCSFAIPQFPLEALDMAYLQVLKASSNSIKDLPDDLDRLTNLQVLHLDHNLLETLPAGVRFLTALEDLQVNDNLLHDICRDWRVRQPQKAQPPREQPGDAAAHDGQLQSPHAAYHPEESHDCSPAVAEPLPGDACGVDPRREARRSLRAFVSWFCRELSAVLSSAKSSELAITLLRNVQVEARLPFFFFAGSVRLSRLADRSG